MKVFMVFNSFGPVGAAESFDDAKALAAEFVNANGAEIPETDSLKIIECELGDYCDSDKGVDFWSVSEGCFLV